MPDPIPVTGETTRVGILGWPVDHSRSPAMHNAAHVELGIDAHYHLVPTAPHELEATVVALGALGWRGVNVTIPHKVAVLDLCDELTPTARGIGAVNVVTFDEGRVVGDNTDARGFVEGLATQTSWSGGGRAVILGTGGAARAVAVGLASEGTEVVVVGRRESAVAELRALASAFGPPAHGRSVDDVEVVRHDIRTADLVVNATSLGMHGESLPAPFEELRSGQIACDVVYRPAQTPFLVAAAAAGALAHGGLAMLVHQAALGFVRWHGCEAPIEVLREAADG